ncbi:hypothetical protein ACU4GR_23600, partial [Methylobacterium oryzae CBMB20]
MPLPRAGSLEAQDEQIGAVLDEAAGVARRQRDVGDAGIGRIGRVDLAAGRPDDPLIGAGLSEARPPNGSTAVTSIPTIRAEAGVAAGSAQTERGQAGTRARGADEHSSIPPDFCRGGRTRPGGRFRRVRLLPVDSILATGISRLRQRTDRGARPRENRRGALTLRFG